MSSTPYNLNIILTLFYVLPYLIFKITITVQIPSLLRLFHSLRRLTYIYFQRIRLFVWPEQKIQETDHQK